MTTGIWVGELDLERPGAAPRGILEPTPTATDTTARLLLRRGHNVMGVLDAPVSDGRVCTETLATPEPVNRHRDDAVLVVEEPITVVVCTRDRPEVLRGCLERLQQLRYPHFEVLVVDNAPSTDATRELVESFAAHDRRFRYTREPRPGLSCARNHGLRAATSRIVAYTDDDVLVDQWWLHGIARGFARSAAVTCVTGIVPAAELRDPGQVYFEERYTWGESFQPRLYDLGEHADPHPLYPFSAGIFGTGANFAVDRHAFLDAGGFDEALGAGTPAKGGEDLDAFVRVLFAGGAIAYEPSALVWHRHRASPEEQRAQLRGYGVGLGAYVTKCLLDPALRRGVVRRIPRGAAHLVRAWRSAPAVDAGPKAAVRTEALGIVRGPAAYLRGRTGAQVLTWRDAATPIALGLWLTACLRINPEAMTSWGLLPALPLTFYAAFALVVVSAGIQLGARRLSPVRLAVHLAALVVMVHGTAPIVLDGPIYAWVYKHLGVIAYLGANGAIDPSVDIYQNWPGFFAAAAWFTNVSGLGDATRFAGWAPVFFNLVACLELAFVFRTLQVGARTRWIALFLFVAGNWVGQDYLAPQALAFVLALAVLALALGRIGAAATSHATLMRVALLYVAFGAVVITHQLSPFALIIAIGLLTLRRLVRPWWLVAGLVVITGLYMGWHWDYLSRTQDLVGPIGDPIRNLLGPPSDSVPLPGRRITALGAPALVFWLLLLAAVGVVQRRRTSAPLQGLVILLLAPSLIAFGQNYGGEVVFRIYLFSMPWLAVLAASAWESTPLRWWRTASLTVGVGVAVGLLGLTFFGALELYRVRPGETAAARYFYNHAAPGSLLVLTSPNFPTRVAANYDEFFLAGENPPAVLSEFKSLRHRPLGPEHVARIADFVERRTPPGRKGYLAMSQGQTDFAEIAGITPSGALDDLGRALRSSPRFSVFYENRDATLFELNGSGVVAPRASAPVVPTPREAPWDPVGIAIAVVGVAVTAAVARRTRRPNDTVLEKEQPMPSQPPAVPAEDAITRIAALHDLDPATSPDAAQLRITAREDLSPAVRIAALEQLGHCDDAEQLAALRDAAADPQAPVRAAALRALPVASSPTGARLVFEAFDDADPDVRQAAYACAAASGEWVLWLGLRAVNDPDALTKVARENLGEERLRALVADRAQSPDAADRELAVRLARVLGGSAADSAIANALLDPDPAARLAAIRAITLDGTAVGPLVDRVVEDPDPMVRLAALDAVRDFEDDRVVTALARAVTDPDADVRAIALDGCKRHNSLGLAKLLASRIDAGNVVVLTDVLLQLGPVGEEVLVTRAADDDEAATAVARLVRGTPVETRARAATQGLDAERRDRAHRALARMATTADNLIDLSEAAALSTPSPSQVS